MNQQILTSKWMQHKILDYRAALGRLLDPTPRGQLARRTAEVFLSQQQSDEDEASKIAATSMIVDILKSPAKFGEQTQPILDAALRVLDAETTALLFDEITPTNEINSSQTQQGKLEEYIGKIEILQHGQQVQHFSESPGMELSDQEADRRADEQVNRFRGGIKT